MTAPRYFKTDQTRLSALERDIRFLKRRVAGRDEDKTDDILAAAAAGALDYFAIECWDALAQTGTGLFGSGFGPCWDGVGADSTPRFTSSFAGNDLDNLADFGIIARGPVTEEGAPSGFTVVDYATNPYFSQWLVFFGIPGGPDEPRPLPGFDYEDVIAGDPGNFIFSQLAGNSGDDAHTKSRGMATALWRQFSTATLIRNPLETATDEWRIDPEFGHAGFTFLAIRIGKKNPGAG